ncbi:cobalamin B12-binding domain-containing protein [Paucibacter sp. B2R-40]|nr:cobalamin B12-binding domain-containing protein [Paucibacter sp. B2R-40]
MPQPVPRLISSEDLQRLFLLKGAAADYACQAFYDKFGERYAQFGERGRQLCLEDLHHHLDFLLPTLATGLAAPFSAYLCWVREMLGARHIPSEHIDICLRWMVEYLANSLGEEGPLLTDWLDAALRESNEPGRPVVAPSRHAPFDIQTRFEDALLTGDRRGALQMVADLESQGHGLVEIEVRLVENCLRSIGQRWQRNEVSVAQEHLATATASTVMAERFAHHPLPASLGHKAVLASVQGNQHSVGLRMVSDALELAGWDVQCLGANTPTRDLVRQIQQWQPDLVALSVAFPSQLADARHAIQQIRQACPLNSPRIIVGGMVLNQHPGLADFLGADAFAHDALAVTVPPLPLLGELPAR